MKKARTETKWKHVLVLLIFVLGVPGVGRAQDCCLIKRDLSDIDPKCVPGAMVGPEEMLKGEGKGECPYGVVDSDHVTEKWGACCLVNILSKLFEWIAFPFLVLAVFLGLLGLSFVFLIFLLLVLGFISQLFGVGIATRKVQAAKRFLCNLLERFWKIGVASVLIFSLLRIAPWILKMIF